MDYVLKLYNQKCRETYQNIGFKKHGQTWGRIINDVFQVFNLKRMRSGRECTIEFGILPLCMELPEYMSGIYDLSLFHPERDGWMYDKRSDQSCQHCIEAMFTVMDQKVLPIFETVLSCEEAFPRMIEIEKQFEQIRIASLRQHNYEDRASPFDVRTRLSIPNYYLALKIKNYTFAKECLHEWIDSYKRNENRYVELLESKSTVLEREFLLDNIKRFQDKIINLSAKIQMIDNKEFTEIERILIGREATSRNNLKRFSENG